MLRSLCNAHSRNSDTAAVWPAISLSMSDNARRHATLHRAHHGIQGLAARRFHPQMDARFCRGQPLVQIAAQFVL